MSNKIHALVLRKNGVAPWVRHHSFDALWG